MHDNPALAAAAAKGTVLPLFIFDEALIKADTASTNRTKFLLESLADLKQSLQKLGADLAIAHGDPGAILANIARQISADAVYCTEDFTPYARLRDEAVADFCVKGGIEFSTFPGKLLATDVTAIKTGSGEPYKVFTPFWRAWQKRTRRTIAPIPTAIKMPAYVCKELPSLETLTKRTNISPHAFVGGEHNALQRLKAFVENDLASYADTHDNLAADATSRLSPYLHFGCISAQHIVDALPDSSSSEAFTRQLVWRDFYHYVLYFYPKNRTQEFQERFRDFPWSYDKELFEAWKEGRTGYPIVDSAMRQLKTEGWMHNRARLIVGSFLTKDLGIDWRWGERYFMQMLIDGDSANNNGNWQWIASVGVDPAPVFRRLYNPSSQAKRYDPEGAYIKRYVPELRNVPLKFLVEPWRMSSEDQQKYTCTIGTDYPAPIVDHASARQAALEKYRSA